MSPSDDHAIFENLTESLYYLNGELAFDHTTKYFFYPDRSLMTLGQKKYWPNGQVAIDYETIELWDKNGTQRKDKYLNEYDREGNITFASGYGPDNLPSYEFENLPEFIATSDDVFEDENAIAFEEHIHPVE